MLKFTSLGFILLKVAALFFPFRGICGIKREMIKLSSLIPSISSHKEVRNKNITATLRDALAGEREEKALNEV